MTLTLMFFAGAALQELLVHLLGRWPAARRFWAGLAIFSGGFMAMALVLFRPNLFSVILLVLSMYRMFNMIRVVQERMHKRYLQTATRRTSLVLLLMQGVVFGGWWAWERWQADGSVIWTVLALLQVIVAVILALSVARTLRKTAWPTDESHWSDHELPTVTVAVPARNETEDLQRCLETVIASDYPKLEILVLDDCSQNKRTPEIIKQFAHDGVRFIQGHEPSETWLPKNQAYARLTDEASGEYILFCGVDIRFERHTIRHMLSVMKARNKQMLCILPQRAQEAYGQASLIQAMRYWWELVPPRRLFNRPPVISSCWAIRRQALQKAGGFAAVARSIMPEAHFAKALLASDGYSFLRSTDSLGVGSVKQVSEQRDTAVRMRYPQMHRRPEQVALLTFAESIFLLLPFVLSLAGFWVAIGRSAHLLVILASLLLIVAYVCSVVSTRVNTWWFGLIGQPFAVLTDIALLHYSMWKYELSTVDWKGRNVCIPVMHVVPGLPSDRRNGPTDPLSLR